MNKRQKILTVAFLILLAATVVWEPWLRVGGGRGYYWIFGEPFPAVLSGSKLNWSQLVTEWVSLIILFICLYAVLRTPRR